MQVQSFPEKKELTQHGEQIFPIERYIAQLSESKRAVRAHWHDEMEITLITKGKCVYQIHMTPYSVEEGDIIFTTPQMLHTFIYDNDSCVSETYVFHTNLLSSRPGDLCTIRYLAPIANHQIILPCVITQSHPAYEFVLDHFHKLQRAWEDQLFGYEIIVKSELLAIIALLLPYSEKGLRKKEAHTGQIEKLKVALEYMEEHYSEPLSIADIAAVCFFSEYYFMRFFKKCIGTSCGEYLKNLRLEKAAAFLASGSKTILEAAFESGFHNQSYFYREFQKKYGMTPKQFLAKAKMQ